MSTLWLWFFSLLSLAIGLRQYSTSFINRDKPKNDFSNAHHKLNNGHCLKHNKQFPIFQKWYIVIFTLSRLSDWMLGPYVYKVYDSYHYSEYNKAVLFIFGYLISGLFGIFVGSIADRFGRKLICIVFCVLFSMSSIIMIHFGSHFVHLLFGRCLSGIATSILHSVFESWMITHHHMHQYPKNELNQTLEIGNRFNATAAIASGIVGSYSISIYQTYNILPFAPACCAPFHVSCVLLIVTLILIVLHWEENYGVHHTIGHNKTGLIHTIQHSLHIILSDKRILFIGFIQSGFESALYIFVFMWTQQLDSVYTHGVLDHGVVFAIMMLSCFIGTCIVTIIRLKWNTNDETRHFAWIQCMELKVLCAVCGISLFMVVLISEFNFRLFMFVVYEICVGCYRPTLSSLRSTYVPHQYMATIINIFRVPLNIIVVAVLLHIDSFGDNVFIIAAFLCFVCCSVAKRFAKIV